MEHTGEKENADAHERNPKQKEKRFFFFSFLFSFIENTAGSVLKPRRFVLLYLYVYSIKYKFYIDGREGESGTISVLWIL